MIWANAPHPVSAKTSPPPHHHPLCSNHNDLLSVPQPQKLFATLGPFHIHSLSLECSLYTCPSTVFPPGSLSRASDLDYISSLRTDVCVCQLHLGTLVLRRIVSLPSQEGHYLLFSLPCFQFQDSDYTKQALNICLLDKQADSDGESLLSLS